MSIINLHSVSHDFGNKLLFEDICLSLDSNTRAGLIGRNGTGKTTLFKIITKAIEPTAGSVHIAKGYKIGYFEQGVDFRSSETLWDWLYQSRADLIQKKAELNQVEYALSDSHEQNLLDKLHQLQTEYELLGGYEYENQIKSLLWTFGFHTDDYTAPIDDLSGGQKTRIRLIHLLLNKYDFILFDEPTNHLDLLTVDWFISYLKNLECGYLIVSHDRYLLDQTVKKIFELKNKRIDTYTGGYSAYVVQSGERETLLQKQYQQQQKLIDRTEDFIVRNMAGQKVKQAKSRLKMLNRMERIELDSKQKDIHLNIQTSHRSGNDIYRLKDLQIGYENNVLASDIHLDLHYKDKVCLIGANGSGKTTLLKVLTGELSPLGGDLWTGFNLTVGYYDQLHIDLNDDLTVLETIWNLAPGEPFGYVMSYLARFGFYEDMIDQTVDSLSGGERARLYLAQLIHEKPNLLILDEPTNHLDISMILSLENALKHYDGTLILVSHDRLFIQNITNHFWVIRENTIIQIKDSFENIIDIKNPYVMQKPPEKPETPKSTPTSKPKKTNPFLLNKLHNEIEDLASEIALCEQSICDVQSRFALSEFYTDPANITLANTQIAQLKNELATLMLKKDQLETEYLLLL